MKNQTLFHVTLFTAALMTGCSTVPQHPFPHDTMAHYGSGPHTPSRRILTTKIYSQYEEWRGTQYAWGGLSKRGIDCSGLVYTTYRDVLGVELPRSTAQQSRVGREIRRNELRPGDLVFFKTGVKERHVGIYIENDKFLHTSTQKGVTISTLQNQYWNNRYWQARRVYL